MKPKEKAKELIDKYWDDLEIGFINSKKCALIAVDEILKSIRWSSDFNNEQRNYWKEVKEEIEKP